MGQTLSEPIVDKYTTLGRDSRIAWAATEMQAMEDAHTTILQLEDSLPNHMSLFAVYDGHGGANAAKYSGVHLHSNLVATEAYKDGRYGEALKSAFLLTDSNLRQDPANGKDGCTAVVTLVTNDKTIYCANAGDSRAVLSDAGVAEPLSHDHKPTNQGEYNRIVAAGGFVEFGRVNGNLALSRAIGDFEFKGNPAFAVEDQVVTCNPEISEHIYKDSYEFYVVACDGIWDVMTSQQVINFVSARVHEGKSLETICEEMTDNCLAKESMGGLGCDNMTVVICAFLNGESEEMWREKISKRYLSSLPPSDAITEAKVEKFTQWSQTCKDLHPEWEYKFWTDEDLLNLVKSDYPSFLHRFTNFRNWINRVDSARYMILYKYGGIFVDLDIECFKPFDEFTNWGGIVMARMSENDTLPFAEHNVPNSWMASIPSHPFWIQALNSLKLSRTQGVESVSGSVFLDEELKKWAWDESLPDINFVQPGLIFPFDWRVNDGKGDVCSAQSDNFDTGKCKSMINPGAYSVSYWTKIWGDWRMLDNILVH